MICRQLPTGKSVPPITKPVCYILFCLQHAWSSSEHKQKVQQGQIKLCKWQHFKGCVSQNVAPFLLDLVANWVKHRECLCCIFILALDSSFLKEMSHDIWWVAPFQQCQGQVLYAAVGCCQAAATQDRRSCVTSNVCPHVIKNRAEAQLPSICSVATPHSKTASLAELKSLVQRSHWKANHFNLWYRKRFCSQADNSCSLVFIEWSSVIMMAKTVKQMLQILLVWFIKVENSLSACHRKMQNFTSSVLQTQLSR